MLMGFSFWYLGNGFDYLFIPSSITFYHRQYILGMNQEEVIFSTSRFLAQLKGVYLTNGIEAVDENGNIVGQYSPYFLGINTFVVNKNLLNKGWSFGVGPGILVGNIYKWSSYLFTINGLVRGYDEDWDVMIMVQNLGIGYSSESGFGKVLSSPELFVSGRKYFKSIGVGSFVRFYGDIDYDFGGYLSIKFPISEIYVSPSYKNLTAGISLQAFFLGFHYSYQYIPLLGYGTHRIGISYLLEKRNIFERRLKKVEEHERILAEHEKRLSEVERKINELEKGARVYANQLVDQALNTPDPEKALLKLEIAKAFSDDTTIDKKMDSLRNVIVGNKRKSYIDRINTLMKNRLYTDALAEAYLMLEEFPDDTTAKRMISKIKRKLKPKKRKEAEKEAKEKAFKKTESIINMLLSKGEVIKANELIKKLPEGSAKRKFKERINSIVDEWMAKAKRAIAERKYVLAKYYLEKILRIKADPEATSLLSWVIQQIKDNASSLYMKSLQAYQQGDIVKAYAYIKQAYEMEPTNEKYRNVYFRLKNAVEK